MKLQLLFYYVHNIIGVIKKKRIFIFADNDKDLDDVCNYLKTCGECQSRIETFKEPKEVLYQVNSKKFDEGYIVENPKKKSTTEILTTFIRKDVPTIKLKTISSGL